MMLEVYYTWWLNNLNLISQKYEVKNKKKKCVKLKIPTQTRPLQSVSSDVRWSWWEKIETQDELLVGELEEHND